MKSSHVAHPALIFPFNNRLNTLPTSFLCSYRSSTNWFHLLKLVNVRRFFIRADIRFSTLRCRRISWTLFNQHVKHLSIRSPFKRLATFSIKRCMCFLLDMKSSHVAHPALKFDFVSLLKTLFTVALWYCLSFHMPCHLEKHRQSASALNRVNTRVINCCTRRSSCFFCCFISKTFVFHASKQYTKDAFVILSVTRLIKRWIPRFVFASSIHDWNALKIFLLVKRNKVFFTSFLWYTRSSTYSNQRL